MVVIGTQGGDSAPLSAPFLLQRGVDTGQRLLHVVFPRGAVPHAVLCLVQTDVNVIGTVLQAERESAGYAEGDGAGIAGIHAVDATVFGLFELVAAQRIFQEIGEVGEQLQAVVHDVAIEADDGLASVPAPVA